jgi:quercetin dioxygenase-like cupin family protein
MKRVVTGHDENGKSVFLKISEPEHVVKSPYYIWNEIWATFPDTKVPVEPGFEPTKSAQWKSVFPEVGETRVRIVEVDPAEQEAIANLPESEQLQIEEQIKEKLPGLQEQMETEDAAMHTTDSVDYGVVLSGKVALELDDGATVDLEQGDIVVQNGTRHAWRFKEKTTMLWILIGAERR